MAIKTLDQLPQASTLTGDELSLVLQNGFARKMPLNSIVLATDPRLTDARTPLTHSHSSASLGLATVATSGSYADLTDKPTAVTGTSLGLATVATSGSYVDLINKPIIVTSYNDLTDKPAAVTTTSLGLATVATSGAYADLINKPTTFTPSTHTHASADVTDLGSTITTAITTERIATATLSSKTLTAPAITGAYTEQASAFTNSGTTYTIDLSTGTIKGLTLTGACTLTFPAVGAGKQFTAFLKQDATGSRLVTWPATVRWAGGVAPTLTTTASKTDVISFVCDPSSTYWMGFVGGLNYTLA